MAPTNPKLWPPTCNPYFDSYNTIFNLKRLIKNVLSHSKVVFDAN